MEDDFFEIFRDGHPSLAWMAALILFRQRD
jgi:hypothetical protein